MQDSRFRTHLRVAGSLSAMMVMVLAPMAQAEQAASVDTLRERYASLASIKTLEAAVDARLAATPAQSIAFRCTQKPSQTLSFSLDETTGYVKLGAHEYFYQDNAIALVRVRDGSSDARYYFRQIDGVTHRFRCEHTDTTTQEMRLIPCAGDVSLDAKTVLGAVQSELYDAALQGRPDCSYSGGEKAVIATIRKHFGQLSQLETTQWVTAYNDTDGIEATESFSRNIDDAGTGKLTHRTQVLWSLTDQPGSDFSSCEGRLDQQYPDSEGMCTTERKTRERTYYYHSGLLFFVFETYDLTSKTCVQNCKPVWDTQWNCTVECDERISAKRERRLYYSGAELIRCLETNVRSKAKSACPKYGMGEYWGSGHALIDASADVVKTRVKAMTADDYR